MYKKLRTIKLYVAVYIDSIKVLRHLFSLFFSNICDGLKELRTNRLWHILLFLLQFSSCFSMEEAKKNMYAFSTTTYTGFQCTVDEETSEKFKGYLVFAYPVWIYDYLGGSPA